MRPRTALLLSTVVALSCPAIGWAKPPRRMVSVSALSSLRVNVYSLDTEPLNGFIPQLVMGLTDEQDSDSQYSGVEGFGIKTSAPGGNALPITASSPLYVVATLDSGSSADIVSYESAQAFDLQGADLLGSKVTTISGASGNEDVTITNALGVYATDFSHAAFNGSGGVTVTAGSLQGHYNVPILQGNQGDGLPNIIGAPILAQYRATIQTSVPQHLTVAGVVSQTPKVTLGSFSSSIPTGYLKLSLSAFDSASQSAETVTSPYYINFDLTGPRDPDTPGVWASLLTNGGVGLTRNGTTASNQTFLFDTGAQVTVISNDEAASVGIFNASADSADFSVDVQGVGGITHVPGYYLNTLTLLTQGGVMTWNRVPVLVLDVADPRNPSQALPGILGTNLFSDRDMILNTNVGATAQTWVAFGQQMQWNSTSGGNWSNASNWSVVLPNGVDLQANFYGKITAPATVNVDAAFTVGRITFDNANRYTLSGAGPIVMSDSTNAAQITVRTGSHTIAAPISLVSDTTVTVAPNTSTLTVSSVISSNGPHGITVSGFGTLLLTNANTYTGETNVSSGTMTVTGSIAGTSVLTSVGAILNAAGTVNAGLSKFTVLNSGGVVNIGPNPGTSGPAAVTLASLEVGSDPTSKVTVLASPLRANRTVLVTSGVSFDDTTAGQLDLKNNDMIVHGGSLAAVQALVRSGLNTGGTGGYWNGPGIVSSTAAANTAFLTALGVIKNDTGNGTAIYSTVAGNTRGAFAGQNASSTDILVKYTYFGDDNLDGKVDGSDYTRIDNGRLNHLTGWYNGDFNYDGSVDGSDYSLIDNVYNRQSAQLSNSVAFPTAQIAAVPEPVGLVSAAAASLALLCPRARKTRPSAR